LISSVLVVCVGNICRSPVAERVLQAKLPQIAVSSAGLGALVGHSADETAAEIALGHGIGLEGHRAQQFTAALGATCDLILVMEPGHRQEIGRIAPQLLGKTMLFDHWTGGRAIEDPYRTSREFHELTFEKIEAASSAWAQRLQGK
jgi:protein-tyrosine phosphatase